MVPDPALQGVALAAERGSSIGITLYLPGMILSGLAIGRKEWSEAYVQSLAGAFRSAGVSDEVVVGWTVEQQVGAAVSEVPEARTIKLIHIREGRLFGPNPGAALKVPYWRGEIASVL